MKRLSRGGIKGLNVELKEKNLNNNNEPNDFLDIIATEKKINIDKETQQMVNSFFFDYKEILEN
jgi:hypothetical protein